MLYILYYYIIIILFYIVFKIMLFYKNIIYSWFKSNYIYIINIFNINKLNIFNFIFKYSCNLNINILIFCLIKWIFCKNKKKYLSCSKCFNCISFKNKNYFNYYYISNDININLIKEIYNKLLINININNIKIIFFNNFKFNNYYINNFLLKILEENDGKIIFIFSCLNNIFIPNTILSRSFLLKIKFPKEDVILKLLLNKFRNNFNKKLFLSCIRLSNNSPIDSLIWIKKNILVKKNIINLILNLNKFNIDNIIKIINNNNLEINLYILITLFLDFIKYKYKIIKYLYNLDSYFFFKKNIYFLSINDICLILNKIISCLSIIKNVNNINKNILLYDLINFLLIKLNKG